MPTLRLPGLPTLTDEERDSEGALAEALGEMARSLRSIDAGPIAEAAGVPLGEVLASPFALRAVALGVAVGGTHRPRELRRLLPLPGPPEIQDADHDEWIDGVLATGKYQGFVAEAPFAIYDPSHISKWAPHEMLHRAAGFFFAREASRFERYVGARLNELVPVVVFHTVEEALRLDADGPFDRHEAGRAPAAPLERCAWLEADGETLERRCRAGAKRLREGFAHLARELAAIDEELSRGVCVRAPHPSLNASSDAIAYVVGHGERLERDAVAEALVAVPEGTRAEDLGVYRDRVAGLFERLLFEEIHLDLAEAASKRERRVSWDLALRAAHAGAGASDVGAIVEASDPRAALPEALRERVGQDGSSEGLAIDQLRAGLEASVGSALALLEGGGAVEALARSGDLVERGPLADRARGLFSDHAPAADLARFEAALLRARRDDGVERLCDPRGTYLTPHAERIHLSLSHDVLEAHERYFEGEDHTPVRADSHVVVAGGPDGVVVVPLEPAAGAIVEALDRPVARDALEAQLGDSAVEALVDAGVLGPRAVR